MTHFTCYYERRHEHVRMRLFVNHALSGELVMRENEFEDFQKMCEGKVDFIQVWDVR